MAVRFAGSKCPLPIPDYDKLNLSMRIVKTLLLIPFAASLLAADHTDWIVTWGASPSPQLGTEAELQKQKLRFENQTLREIVHTSVGGSTVRVRLSNAYGKETVAIGAAHVALHAKDASIVPGSDHVLTFSGRPSVSIPANAPVLSDPVKLDVPANSDVVVSLFLPNAVTGAGIHYASQQTSYIGKGDLTGAESIADAETMTHWVFLTGLDVLAPHGGATLVAFGDSITDGAASTVNANHRWPNLLAARLLAQSKTKNIGTLDAGIGGNRILHDATTNIMFGINALARYDRDVLAQPGVKYIIVLEGINDLGHAGTAAPLSETVSAEDIIAGLTQLAMRAHERGTKIYGATLTPFAIARAPGYYTPEKEAKRKAINQWIRTTKVFDGFIDFDKAVQDPAHPDSMLPTYDSGDHLHPNDAGYKAMAQAVDLSLFK